MAGRVVTPMDDPPALRQRMQHALFVFRDIHGNQGPPIGVGIRAADNRKTRRLLGYAFRWLRTTPVTGNSRRR